LFVSAKFIGPGYDGCADAFNVEGMAVFICLLSVCCTVKRSVCSEYLVFIPFIRTVLSALSTGAYVGKWTPLQTAASEYYTYSIYLCGWKKQDRSLIRVVVECLYVIAAIVPEFLPLSVAV